MRNKTSHLPRKPRNYERTKKETYFQYEQPCCQEQKFLCIILLGIQGETEIKMRWLVLAHFLHSSHLETLQFTLRQVDWTRCSETVPSNPNDVEFCEQPLPRIKKCSRVSFQGRKSITFKAILIFAPSLPPSEHSQVP